MPWTEDSEIISQFRGLEHSKASGKKPMKSSHLMDDIFKTLNIGGESPAKTIHENWKDILPAKYRGVAELSDVGVSVLYVKVDNSIIAQNMMFEQAKMLAKIQKLPGCSRIRKIRFR